MWVSSCACTDQTLLHISAPALGHFLLMKAAQVEWRPQATVSCSRPTNTEACGNPVSATATSVNPPRDAGMCWDQTPCSAFHCAIRHFFCRQWFLSRAKSKMTVSQLHEDLTPSTHHHSLEAHWCSRYVEEDSGVVAVVMAVMVMVVMVVIVIMMLMMVTVVIVIMMLMVVIEVILM